MKERGCQRGTERSRGRGRQRRLLMQPHWRRLGDAPPRRERQPCEVASVSALAISNAFRFFCSRRFWMLSRQPGSPHAFHAAFAVIFPSEFRTYKMSALGVSQNEGQNAATEGAYHPHRLVALRVRRARHIARQTYHSVWLEPAEKLSRNNGGITPVTQKGAHLATQWC